MNEELVSLSWLRIRASFKCRQDHPRVSSPVCVMEAITKAVSDATWGIPANEWANRPIFHFIRKPYNFKLKEDEIYQVEFLFTDKIQEEVLLWIDNFIHYFTEPEAEKTFIPVDIFPPENRNLYQIMQECGEIPDSGEICLHFLTPLHLKPQPGKSRFWLDAHHFTHSLINRFRRLFSCKFNLADSSRYEILPYYWNYTEIKHRSFSQKGHQQLINGCVGPLYARGELSELKPWLYLATELHAGSKFSNSYGYFILYKNSLPYFDLRFPQLKELETIAQEVVERYDDALLNIINPALPEPDLKNSINNMFTRIRDGTYRPSPHRAFSIRTETGKERQVEQPEPVDLIAGLYALRLLSPVLDKAFEEESLGFRKGRSREKAIELVRQAINQGYLWLVESDIENFFPSINLDLLQSFLDRLLPEKDTSFKSFLKLIIRVPFKVGEKIYPRERGLAQGHPLSPCLTNLYLDSFDEQVKSLDVKLIRYCDDFLIFCRLREQAESVVMEIEKILSGLELKLKKEKTSIKNVSEGFQFLGYNFSGPETDVFLPPETHLLKKPLFITEPYVLVTVDGGSLSIKKAGQVIQSVPLRRISEIMIMEKSVVSTALMARCLKNNIPLTVALESGYALTTIRPDSREYYLISSLHAGKYSRLSEATKIALAREVALTKLHNYIYLFKQKYQPELKPLIRDLNEIIRRLETSSDLNEIRGLEGLAARKIYSSFKNFINNQAFQLSKRQRRPPDRINSLLNLGAHLLYSRINALIRSAGLNPYLGFLHSASDDYESLVSDLVDIFRPRMERFILRLINLRIIDEHSFEESNGGYYLNREGKHRFISHLENELNQKPEAKKLSFKDQISLQVKIIKDWVMKDSSLVFLKWSE